MYRVVYDADPFEFDFGEKGKKKGATLRGDKKYSKDAPDRPVEKMLPFLLKDAVKFRKRYKSVELYDNSKPLNSIERIILKMYKGEVVINRLLSYTKLFKDYPLPPYLAYEKKPEDEL